MRISVDNQDVIVPNNGTSVSVTVTATVDWIASLSVSSSFVISPTSGKSGTTIMQISSSPNTTAADKLADLIVSGGGTSATVHLLQKNLSFSVTPSSLLMESIASTQKIVIASNVAWKIKTEGLPEWIQEISPLTGEGSTEVSIAVSKNSSHQVQEYSLVIEYSGVASLLPIRQQGTHNSPPSKPVNLKPATANTDLVPVFSWDPSIDPENDVITYTVLYSDDAVNWTSVPAGKNNTVSLSSIAKSLQPHTKYFYKVQGDDGQAGGVTESDIINFTTREKNIYADGESQVYQTSTKPNPIKLIFTGDGYLAEHYKYDGLFDKNLEEAIEALFAMEPYKTYREYFTVYKVAAYSAEEGVSSQNPHVTKNTVFSCTLTGGTGIQCDYDKVFSHAMKIPGMTESDLQNTSVCVIINSNVYAGTCYTISNGKSIAMVPVSRHPGMTTTFGNVVCHEYGGHGFGRLADEYVAYNMTVPDGTKETLLLWQAYNYFMNVSPYSTKDQVPWKIFFNKPDYTHVGIYIGGYLYAEGITRSEDISCMDDNRPYFNTQSRYSIVERILQAAGEGTLTYDKFYAKDVEKAPLKTKLLYPDKNFVPLAPPILVLKE